jgi:paraquat-inducible protein A
VDAFVNSRVITAVRATEVGLVACRTCGLVMRRTPILTAPMSCPRCATLLHERLPRSGERTLSWLITGVILYIPSNMLPVMYVSGVGGGEESTILSGVVSFWRAGAWDIAALIFTASIAVPATKFLALGLLLWTVRRKSSWARRQRTALYRLVEIIGYWSMLDVVVVALTAALLQFKALGAAEPRLGIVFFCGVVVTTMIAALSFDPRLIWDSGDRDEQRYRI